MDVHTAENAINRLHSYLKQLADDKPRLYNSSKSKLIEINKTCQDVLNLLSDILDDQIISTVDDNDLEATESIQQQYKQVHGRVSALNNTQNVVSKKSILSSYYRVINALPESVTSNQHVHECADLLKRWMNIRFHDSLRYSANFRYNIQRLPAWICDIVIVFAKHLEDGTLDTFIDGFNSWLDNLLVPNNTCGFAVPFEVFQCDVDVSGSKLTLTAVVLWDVLIDAGLKALIELPGLPLSDSLMYELVASTTPDILDDYVNYKFDPSILKRCHLWSTEVNDQ